MCTFTFIFTKLCCSYLFRSTFYLLSFIFYFVTSLKHIYMAYKIHSTFLRIISIISFVTSSGGITSSVLYFVKRHQKCQDNQSITLNDDTGYTLYEDYKQVRVGEFPLVNNFGSDSTYNVIPSAPVIDPFDADIEKGNL